MGLELKWGVSMHIRSYGLNRVYSLRPFLSEDGSFFLDWLDLLYRS